ncbi:LysM peptidoglycan-binding domain-containing protein [Lewinella sp. IMCC34183]|uniref:muramidase family protein n=1 Tax=Lewinella sp. IMCC34183 TaxID=2248762 RepID=UPI000E2843CC|nr:LysM peptidoglycan-binding domain-containing protein [Lewinella sp. IMCC34183]
MKILFVLLAFLSWKQAMAEQLFILFTEDCGASIRYARSLDGASRMDYFAYSLPAGFGERLILETDGEGVSVRSDLPDGYLRCTEARLGAETAARINDAEDHLFIVRALPEGGYRVEPVVMAAVLEERDTEIRYRSPFTAFTFDTENGVIGVNLDTANEGASVTFEGREGNGCQSTYLLRQYNPAGAFPYIIYRLAPGLGIVERRLTGDGRSNPDEVITAAGVNDLTLPAFLEARCATKQQEAAFVPLYIEPEAAPQPSGIARPAYPVSPQAKVATYDAPETPAPAPVTVHEVTRGETLYAIARRYGVSVAELQRNNNLSSSTIFVGQQLKIEGSTSAPAIPAPPVTVPQERPDPVVNVPDRYPAQGEYHTVRPGETFASLALRYGYTTQRFKEFNNLQDAAVARVGQQLRTSHCSCPPAGQVTEVTEPAPPPPSAPVRVPTPEEEPYRPVPYGSTPTYPATYPEAPRPVAVPTPNVVVPPPPAADPSTGPDRRIEPAYSSPPPPAYGAPVQANRAVHIVQEGESLYGIARQYRISVEELRTYNELQPADVIVPYQKLYVN